MENNHAYLLRTEITKSHLNNRICQLCDVKTSTGTLFIMFLISHYHVTSKYQVSSETYGGFFYKGITLIQFTQLYSRKFEDQGYKWMTNLNDNPTDTYCNNIIISPFNTPDIPHILTRWCTGSIFQLYIIHRNVSFIACSPDSLKHQLNKSRKGK